MTDDRASGGNCPFTASGQHGVQHTDSMTLDGYKAAIDREAAVLRTAGEVVTDDDVFSSFLAGVWRETRKTALRTADYSVVGVDMLRNDLFRKDARLVSAWTERQDRILDAARVLQMKGVKVPRVSGVLGATSSDAESLTRKDLLCATTEEPTADR
eukprot:scaffold242074_cov16-Prasinocladus_malaysianus.AAC.2